MPEPEGQVVAQLYACRQSHQTVFASLKKENNQVSGEKVFRRGRNDSATEKSAWRRCPPGELHTTQAVMRTDYRAGTNAEEEAPATSDKIVFMGLD